jgi:hypothetical protein
MAWADGEESVHALIQIGSQVRGGGEPGAADDHSDWDFQVISSAPAALERPELYTAFMGAPLAFAVRGGRLGTARKVTVLFAEGELDIVVIPLAQFEEVRHQVRAGTFAQIPPIVKALEDLASVLLGGYRIAKGAPEVADLYRFVTSRISPPRLSDPAIRQLGEAFVCDYVSTARKIARGEYIAAQRWLHHQLAETNFSLAHEFRRRSGLPSFPDARRVESLLAEADRCALEVSASPTRDSLRAALEKSKGTCLALIHALVGDTWSWPALPSSLSGE